MLPLDFEEFCWAMGVPSSILETARSCYHAKTPLEATLHDGLTRLFRQHIAVGGMPEAVQGFLNRHRDLGKAARPTPTSSSSTDTASPGTQGRARSGTAQHNGQYRPPEQSCCPSIFVIGARKGNSVPFDIWENRQNNSFGHIHFL